MIETGTANTTRFLENGNEVYPCCCGKTHRGDYAFYDWIHHECLHPTDLISVRPDHPYVICPDCGATWGIEDA